MKTEILENLEESLMGILQVLKSVWFRVRYSNSVISVDSHMLKLLELSGQIRRFNCQVVIYRNRIVIEEWPDDVYGDKVWDEDGGLETAISSWREEVLDRYKDDGRPIEVVRHQSATEFRNTHYEEYQY